MATVYTVGDHEVRVGERLVLRAGEPVALGGRAFDLLLALIERHDRVVGKDELMALVWPRVVVEENNLTVQVSALRKVLGARAVLTIPGRGYRLGVPVAGDAARAGPAVPLANGAQPAAAAPDPPHNLPAERSTFVGRELEIARLRELLARHRLVTLTGIGGTGKTRLALRLAALERPKFHDGVHFVDLAPLTDPGLVPDAMASACGLMFGDGLGGAGGPTDERLVAALASRHCLLVVDNCEHLVAAVAERLDRILSGCPRVVVLATSREALGVEGEQTLPVPSLGLPDDAQRVAEADAMRLFVDRARSVRPDFTLDELNLGAVTEICRHLDGIPLAIEFAAARLAHLSPRQIADRLQDRFRLLAGDRRRVARHQTLEATLDWSHDLLDDGERRLFRRLAVFAGDFTLDAAETVCVGDGLDAAAVLDLLGSLVAKSLVTAETEEGGELRYRLLETVRLYAERKLDGAAEVARLRRRHLERYVDWLQAQTLERLSFDRTVLAAVTREMGNLRAAAEQCFVDQRPELLASLASHLWIYFWIGGFGAEAERWLQEALRGGERLRGDDRVACHALRALLATTELDPERAIEEATRAIALSATGSHPFHVLALCVRGFMLSNVAALPGADPRLAVDARSDCAAAVGLADERHSRPWQIMARWFQAAAEVNLGNLRAASAVYAEVAERCARLDQPGWSQPWSLVQQSVVEHLLGNAPAAERAARGYQALPAGSLAWQRTIGVETAPALVVAGHLDEARAMLRQAVEAVAKSGVPLAVNQLLGVVGVVEHLLGRPHNAARLLAASRHVGGAARLSMPFRTPGHAALYVHYLPIVRAALDADQARQAREAGRALTAEQALGLARRALDGEAPESHRAAER